MHAPAPKKPTSSPGTGGCAPPWARESDRAPVKHSIIVAYWLMLTTGELYHELGSDYFTRLDLDKHRHVSSPTRTPRHVLTPSRQVAA